MNKNKVDEKSVDEAIRFAQGSLKHEDMILTEAEKELIKKRLLGEISEKEFISIVYKKATGKDLA